MLRLPAQSPHLENCGPAPSVNFMVEKQEPGERRDSPGVTPGVRRGTPDRQGSLSPPAQGPSSLLLRRRSCLYDWELLTEVSVGIAWDLANVFRKWSPDFSGEERAGAMGRAGGSVWLGWGQ